MPMTTFCPRGAIIFAATTFDATVVTVVTVVMGVTGDCQTYQSWGYSKHAVIRKGGLHVAGLGSVSNSVSYLFFLTKRPSEAFFI